MTDDVLSPAAPPANYLYGTWMRDVLGNKADLASILSSASAMALLRYIQESLDAFVLSPYQKVVDFPEFASEDSVVVLAIGLYDKATWQEIPVADITAGTVRVIRLRAGVPTTITAAAALLKQDGLLYVSIDTDNANWANGDLVKLEPVTISTIDIGLDTFNVSFAPQICKLSDYGLLGDNITSILTTITDMYKGMIEGDGFSSVYAIIDQDITFQISLGDLIEDFPAIGEITSPGTCTVIRIRPGVGAATIVGSQACFAGANGNVGYTYGWPNASWSKGDVAEITFSGITVTKNGKTFDLPDYEVYVPIGLPEMLQGWDAVVQNIDDIETLVNQIITDISGLDAKIDIIDTNVDDIETLLGVVDGKVDITDANVDLLVEKPQPFEVWGTTLNPGASLVISTVPLTVGIGDVTLPNLPVGTFKRAEIIFSFRKVENIYAGVNSLTTGAVEVLDSTGGVWTPGYSVVPGELTTNQDISEGQGRDIYGLIDVIAEVADMNRRYDFRVNGLTSVGDDLIIHDVRVGLRIWV